MKISATNLRQLTSHLIGVMLVATGCQGAAGGEGSEGIPSDPSPPVAELPVTPVLLRARVLHSYPHDATRYTQGLVWTDGDLLIESYGRYGSSGLAKWHLGDGHVQAEIELEDSFFAEGVTLHDGRLFQLTWREGRAFVYSQDDLAVVDRLSYQGEGWGIAWDGAFLITSDGSATLSFRRPTDFVVVRRVTVRRAGVAQRQLNELEYFNGRLYANVWTADEIVEIDPETGAITAVIDASGLLNDQETATSEVLNGIAFRESTGTVLLTGKYWPRLFEVEFVPR